MDRSSWRTKEKVVALLEKTLARDAEINHDVRLPDVTTGESRQFDVVAYYGKEPRRFVAVAEVQKRGRKVGLPTFQGWYAKMRSVGAQMLICVSEAGYTESVKKEVHLKAGPTAKLLTLMDLEQQAWPFGFSIAPYRIRVTFVNFEADSVRVFSPPGSGVGEGWLSPSDPQWFEDRSSGRRLSIADIFGDAVASDRKVDDLPPGVQKARVAIGTDQCSRLIFVGRGARDAILTIEATVEFDTRDVEIPFQVSEYRQIDRDGALAWVADAQGQCEGRDIGLTFTFTVDSDGMLQPQLAKATNDPKGLIVSKVYQERPIPPE